jgi:hypothetical protein
VVQVLYDVRQKQAGMSLVQHRRVLVAIGLLGLIVVTSFMVLATLLLVFVATMNAVS